MEAEVPKVLNLHSSESSLTGVDNGWMDNNKKPLREQRASPDFDYIHNVSPLSFCSFSLLSHQHR